MTNLFSTKPQQSVVEKHESISNDAFALFNDTVNKLTVANDLIDGDIRTVEAEVQAAIDKKNALISIKKKNETLHSNIKKFFAQ